jgi:uncharacterized protein
MLLTQVPFPKRSEDLVPSFGECELNLTRKQWLILLTGWGFVLLGIAGLLLPVLQGVLFLLIGLVILSSEYVWAHHVLESLQKRFPKLAAHVHTASEKARSRMNRTPTNS